MPSAVQIFRPADFHDQPWKNGGGTTRELLRAPHPHDPVKFAWRVSCATVASSGPFSVFPGVDRTLMLLDGDGFALRCGNAPEATLTKRGQMVHFSGDMDTHCRLLGGPSQDFNLMVDRTLFRSEISLLRSDDTKQDQPCTPVCLLYLLQGKIGLSAPRHCQPTAGELVRLRDAGNLHFESASADFLAVKVDLFAIA